MKNPIIKIDSVEISAYKYAVQGNCILGTRGAGKTNASKYIAESLMDIGIPIIVIDPVGKWRYMNTASDADGGKAYPVVVVGKGGDVELSVDTIQDVIRYALLKRVSLVIDLYDKEYLDQWDDIVSAIMEVLFYDNEKFGLRHIIFEEAAELIHQQGKKTHTSVWIEKIVRIAGNLKLGVTFINQTSEQLSKAVLKLCDGLILGRQTELNSLDSLNKWLNRLKVTSGKDIVASIPTLKDGEFYIWSKAESDPVKATFPLARSYHPSRHEIEENDLNMEVDISSAVIDMQRFGSQERIPVNYAILQSNVIERVEVQSAPLIDVQLNTSSLTEHEKLIVHLASKTPYGDQTVKDYIDRLVSRGYTTLVSVSPSVSYLTNGITRINLESKSEKEYSQVLLKNLGFFKV